MEHLSQEVSLTLFPKKQDDVPTPPPLPAQSPVVVLEDEDHLTALPASISRALAFALRP